MWSKGESGQLGLGRKLRSCSVPQRIMVTKVVRGVRHVVALTQVGHVYTWGYGGDGQLGNGHRENLSSPRRIGVPEQRYVDVTAGRYLTALVTQQGHVYYCGTLFSELTTSLTRISMPEGVEALTVSSGDLHMMILTRNGSEQLGTGDDQPREVPHLVMLVMTQVQSVKGIRQWSFGGMEASMNGVGGLHHVHTCRPNPTKFV